MSTSTNSIPNATIEVMVRSLFKETNRYGFRQVDYLRFVNMLLDISMKNGRDPQRPAPGSHAYDAAKQSDLPLIGEQTKVRRLVEADDKALLQQWLVDDEGRHFLRSRITAQLVTVDELLTQQQHILGLITLNQSNEKPVGLIAFFDYDPLQRKAELRKLIRESQFQRVGITREAITLWVQFGIATLGLNKIYINTTDTNIRNIKLYEELGFKVEGILRNECFFEGKYHDVLKMGLVTE